MSLFWEFQGLFPNNLKNGILVDIYTGIFLLIIQLVLFDSGLRIGEVYYFSLSFNEN